MLKIVDNNILNFFIGLIPVVFLFIYEFITTRRKTLPVMLLGISIGAIISYLIAGWPTLIASAIIMGIVIFLKIRDKYDE